MIFFKKRYKFIAALATIFIQLFLLLILNLTFSDNKSRIPTDTENDEILLALQDIAPEEIVLPPSAKQLTKQENKVTEKINKQNEPDQPVLKPNTSTTLSENPEEQAMQKAVETVIPTPSIAQSLVNDSIKDSLKTKAVKNFKKVIASSDSAYKEYLRRNKQRIEYNKKNYKNIRNFLKVYPYALKTKEIIDSLNNKLALITNNSEKKRLINETEKKLFQEYEKAVRTMTISQGQLLLKLIARETNKTGFEIIKDYKGAFPASFWYGVGKIFGTDLKTEFHKENGDSIIEDILQRKNKGNL